MEWFVDDLEGGFEHMLHLHEIEYELRHATTQDKVKRVYTQWRPLIRYTNKEREWKLG